MSCNFWFNALNKNELFVTSSFPFNLCCFHTTLNLKTYAFNTLLENTLNVFFMRLKIQIYKHFYFVTALCKDFIIRYQLLMLIAIYPAGNFSRRSVHFGENLKTLHCLKNLPKYCKGKVHRFECFFEGKKGVFRITGDRGWIFWIFEYLMGSLNFQIQIKIGDSSL